MIVRVEIAEMSVSSPITGSLCNTLQGQLVPSATLVPPPYLEEDPLIQGGILRVSRSAG